MLFCFVFFVKFSYWSKFHVNIITGFGVMNIFFYKWLTRNPEIGNTPVWVLPNIWRLGRIRDTKFGTDVSNEMLLNAAKYQGYSFYRFWVIKGRPTWGVKLPPLTQIRVNFIKNERRHRYVSSRTPLSGWFKIVSVSYNIFQRNTWKSESL